MKSYAMVMRDGSSLNGVKMSGPFTFEAEMTDDQWLKCNAHDIWEATERLEMLAQVCGGTLKGEPKAC